MTADATMLHKHILPVAENLRDNARAIELEENEYYMGRKRHAEPGESEAMLQAVSGGLSEG